MDALRVLVVAGLLDVIVQRGYHERLGARPMRDATELLIRKALARELLDGRAGAGRLRPHPNGMELQLYPVSTTPN